MKKTVLKSALLIGSFAATTTMTLQAQTDNTTLGTNALSNVVTGSFNTAIGYYPLTNNTNGHYNIAIGASVLRTNTTGSQNTAMGYNALYGNTTGSYNIGLGYYAGRYIANGSTANATSSYSIFIGSSTKAQADSQSNQIVIGYNATGNGSNSVTLGGDAITKTVLKGNVGIGTTSPAAPLHITKTTAINSNNVAAILGNAAFDWTYFGGNAGGRIRGSNEGYLLLESNPNATIDKTLYLNYTSDGNIIAALGGGNMGIGKYPAYKLDVNGDIRATSDITASGSLTAAYLHSTLGVVRIDNPEKTAANEAHHWVIYNMRENYGNSLQFWAYQDGTTCEDGGLCANRFTITDAGNVGIGTMFPQYKLDVKGEIRATKMRVENISNFPDFVFDKNYNLRSLDEVKTFIDKNGHLPEIPTAAEVAENGMSIDDMQVKLLQKVEELTLYVIQQQAEISKLNAVINELTPKK